MDRIQTHTHSHTHSCTNLIYRRRTTLSIGHLYDAKFAATRANPADQAEPTPKATAFYKTFIFL